MTINVEVPLNALRDKRVAQALANLMMALGNIGGSTQRNVESSGATAAQVVTRPSAPARQRRPARTKQLTGTPAERLEKFREGLPKRSRAFLDLVRKRGTVSIDEVIADLDIKVPKAIGGITGSLNRWARQRGVNLPIVAEQTPQGTRVWRWTGMGHEPSDTTKDVPDPAPLTEVQDVGADGAPIAAESDATDTSPEPLNDDLFADPRYSALVEGTRELSREFLLLLAKRGELTMSQALKQFGLSRGQPMGAVVRALKGRAAEQGVALPFEVTRTVNGERMWRWKPWEDPTAVAAEAKTKRPSVRRRRRTA